MMLSFENFINFKLVVNCKADGNLFFEMFLTLLNRAVLFFSSTFITLFCSESSCKFKIVQMMTITIERKKRLEATQK